MASSLPSPVFAAIGIVPAVLEGVRRLPLKAVQLPVIAISGALTGLDALRKEYEGLADRGEALVSRLRGEAVERADELEERVSDLAGRAPSLSVAYDRTAQTVEDAVEDVVDSAAEALRPPADFARAAADASAERMEAVADAAERVAETAAGVEEPATAPAPAPTPAPKVVQPDTGRVDTAASAAVQEVVQVAVADADTASLEHDDLPLPDYDHMTLGSLRGRLRSLSLDQLVQIRTYERAHADRLPVVTMLDNRIARLASDAGAAPAGSVSTSPAPEQLAAAAGAVGPATTDAPPVNPPSAGVPTNPAQPRA